MGLSRSNDGEARFSAYVEGLTSVIGHADRAKPLRDYCFLMMPCERKSVLTVKGQHACKLIGDWWEWDPNLSGDELTTASRQGEKSTTSCDQTR